jgi:hypothetical protein
LQQLRSIPERFSSESEYLESFKWPFLEEIRANIKHALEGIVHDPTYALISEVRETSTPWTGFSPEGDYVAKLHDSVERCPFKSKDLLLLLRRLPRSVDDLLDSKADAIMALSKQQHDEEPFELKLQMRKADASSVCRDDPEMVWYAIYIGGLATPFRIWEALHGRNLAMIKRILDHNLQLEASDGYDLTLA